MTPEAQTSYLRRKDFEGRKTSERTATDHRGVGRGTGSDRRFSVPISFAQSVSSDPRAFGARVSPPKPKNKSAPAQAAEGAPPRRRGQVDTFEDAKAAWRQCWDSRVPKSHLPSCGAISAELSRQLARRTSLPEIDSPYTKSCLALPDRKSNRSLRLSMASIVPY